MNLRATTATDAARLGLLEVVETYGNDQPNEWKGLVGEVYPDRKQLYETILQSSGLRPAIEYSDGAPMSWDTLTTPYSKSFYPVQYELSVGWSVKAAHNDIYGLYKRVGKNLAKSHYDAMEIAAAAIFNNATSGSYTGIDGVSLANASHPTEGGTASNISTAGRLSVGNLETMVQDLAVQPAYRTGVFADVAPPYELNVGIQDWMIADRILASMLQPATANNDKNVVRSLISGVTVNRRFTSMTAYALVAKKDAPIFKLNGMAFTDFGGIKFWQDPASYKLVTMSEFVFGWRKWQGFQYNAGA